MLPLPCRALKTPVSHVRGELSFAARCADLLKVQELLQAVVERRPQSAPAVVAVIQAVAEPLALLPVEAGDLATATSVSFH